MSDNETNPPASEKPDVNWLIGAWDETVNDLGPFIDQCRENFKTRFAVWEGQTSDGKKRGQNAFPWKGASDLRVYLCDEVIAAQKALLCTSFRKNKLVAVPVEGNDIARAKVVGNFMRWLIMTQMPHIEREVELCADYMLEKGIAATGQYWERRVSQTLEEISMEQIAQTVPDLAAMIQVPENDEAMADMIMQAYPSVKKGKAKKMLRELRSVGKTTVAVPGQIVNRPAIRAYSLDEDLLVPVHVTDIEHAPYVFVKRRYEPEQLREKIVTDGWDEKWVEKVIEAGGANKALDTAWDKPTISRSFIYDEDDNANLCLVVCAYVKQSDEDGVPGIYETVFSPNVPDEYARHGLLGYRHGCYPFVIHRREYLGRRLHDTRGVPEVGKPYQEQIKAQRDARIDNTSLATVPPLRHPVGRPPSAWGPGARVPERRAGEYGYVEKPGYPNESVEVEKMLMGAFNQYFGRPVDEATMVEARSKNQNMVERWLGGWAQAMQQVWSLFQQYGDDQTYFRVIGSVKGEPQKFEKGQPGEKYDFYLSYNAIQAEPEEMLNRLKQIVEFAQAIDRNGQIDYSELLQAVIEEIDPILGERVIQPKEAASEREVKEEQTALARVFAGVEEDIPLGAANELRLQVIQKYLQAPDVMQRAQQDKMFAQRLQKRMSQFQHQITQKANALIGVYGA